MVLLRNSNINMYVAIKLRQKVNTMKSKYSLCLLLCLATSVWAESVAEIELLSAQKAYQAALSSQRTSQRKAQQLQSQLESAQLQLKNAQDNVTRLQSDFNQIDVQRQQADAELQAAGTRLDAAWQAVHNH
jgi:peptidoglycan hydrolase CwlO-like protein